ncbi:MAG: uracil-DNA glycosylase [Mycoplasmatales bacterium]
MNGWTLNIDKDFENTLLQEYKNHSIFPPYEDIFNAFKYSSYEDTKLVIFGQDPYPTKGVANGLSFSVNSDCKIPASLRNIYKELQSDLGIKKKDGNLENIARQGVLLLNTTLTVREGIPNSHKSLGWSTFIDSIIEQLNNKDQKVIFLLLGNESQKLSKKISNHHIIINCTHPSSLSAYRGFLGSNIFTKINSTLNEIGYSEIDFND